MPQIQDQISSRGVPMSALKLVLSLPDEVAAQFRRRELLELLRGGREPSAGFDEVEAALKLLATCVPQRYPAWFAFADRAQRVTHRQAWYALVVALLHNEDDRVRAYALASSAGKAATAGQANRKLRDAMLDVRKRWSDVLGVGAEDVDRHLENAQLYVDAASSGPPPASRDQARGEPSRKHVEVLPPDNPHFFERRELFDDIRDDLDNGGVAVLTGKGGVGKTQNALHYALAEDRYDVVVWLPAETETGIRERMYQLGARFDALQGSHRAPFQIADTVRYEILPQFRTLLVFDNLTEGRLLREWRARGVDALVTTRDDRVDGLGARRGIDSKPFLPEEAARFLAARLDLDGADQEAARRLGDAVAGLPLALEQAAAYIANQRVAMGHYLELLERHPLELLERSRPSTDYSHTVATTWAMNLDQIEREQPAAWELLSACASLNPDRISLDLFLRTPETVGFEFARAMATGLSPMSVLLEQVAHLRRFSLVQLETDNRSVSMHRLMQRVVRRRGGGDG